MILLVGDDDLLASRFLGALLGAGFNAEALRLDDATAEALRTIGPDLLLLDATARAAAAGRAAACMKRVQPDVPVVVVAGDKRAPLADARTTSADFGADLAIKPSCRGATLVNVVGEAIARYQRGRAEQPNPRQEGTCPTSS